MLRGRRPLGSPSRNEDYLARDVPGFAFPVYLAGAQVQRYVAFAPTIGASVNMTLRSYNGTCPVGVMIDTAGVLDTGVLIDWLRAGFEEVLALAGAHDPVRLPIRDAATTDH